MSFKYYLSLVFIIIFTSICFCSQEEQINLSAIADYSVIPSHVFVIKNKLFLDFDAKNLYLTLRMPKQHKKNEIKRLKLDAEKITKKEELIENVENPVDFHMGKSYNPVVTSGRGEIPHRR